MRSMCRFSRSRTQTSSGYLFSGFRTLASQRVCPLVVTDAGQTVTAHGIALIEHAAAMNTKFAKGEILGELKYTTVLLRRLKADAPEKRSAWVRFLVVRADATMAAPMSPRVSNGSVLLVDRHSCSLAGHEKTGQNLYLIRKEQMLILRWAEMQDDILCLRPDSSDYPLDFVRIDRKNPLTSCLVGRVVHIATEFDRPVLGRPLLP